MKKIDAIQIATILILGITTTISSAASANQLTLSQWHQAMNELPTGGMGCFTGAYPSVAWQTTPCVTNAPVQLFTIGDGYSDYQAEPTSGSLTNAEGTFTSESGCSTNGCEHATLFGVPEENLYTEQLNTNRYSTTLQGYNVYYWQQFIYESDPSDLTASVQMQFWIVGNPTAPSCGSIRVGGVSWSGLGAPANTCYHNSQIVTAPYLETSQLTQASLFGGVATSGDTLKFYNGGHVYAATDKDVFSFASNGGWKWAEYNVFGIPGASEAVFDSGVTLSLQNTAYNGAFTQCYTTTSFTTEYNNMNLKSCGGNGEYIAYSQNT